MFFVTDEDGDGRSSKADVERVVVDKNCFQLVSKLDNVWCTVDIKPITEENVGVKISCWQTIKDKKPHTDIFFPLLKNSTFEV